MNALTIKNPADLLSFIGHTLGFWPQESLVCITLNHNNVGATLRIDLPRQPGQERLFARTVASYLTNDTNASSIVFALYTSSRSEPGQPRPHAATIAALTGVLVENEITIRDGIFVGEDTYSRYDTEPGQQITLPLSGTEYSQVNAEFIYRGSTIAPSNQITLPPRTHQIEKRWLLRSGWRPSQPSTQKKLPNKLTDSGQSCWIARSTPPMRTPWT